MTTTSIKNDAMYRVNLKKSIKVGRRTIHAGKSCRLRGDILKKYKDAAASFERVDA